jgi:hypothetical protein
VKKVLKIAEITKIAEIIAKIHQNLPTKASKAVIKQQKASKEINQIVVYANFRHNSTPY